MRPHGRAPGRPARRALALATGRRSRRAQGAVPAAPVRPRRVSGRRQRARPAARPPAEGLRHRHVGASVSGQEAVPELLDHRPALPPGARQVRHEDHRGRDVPPAGGAGRGGRAGRRARARSDDARAARCSCITTTRSARPRKTRSAATSRSTRSSTTSRRSRSSTTSAASTISARASSARSAIRRCGSWKIRCGCCARSALAARLDFTIDPPVLDAIRDARVTRSRAAAAAAAARGVLQDPAVGRGGEDVPHAGPRSACSSRSRPELHRGADEPLWRSLAAVDAYRRRFEGIPDTMTNPMLLGSLLAPLGLLPQPGSRSERPPRHPHASGEGEAAPEKAERRRAPGPKLGELPLARRDVERLQPDRRSCSGGCAISARANAPAARSCTAASSAMRSRGWTCTAGRPTWSRDGRRCSPRRRARRPSRGRPAKASRRALSAAPPPQDRGRRRPAGPRMTHECTSADEFGLAFVHFCIRAIT